MMFEVFVVVQSVAESFRRCTILNRYKMSELTAFTLKDAAGPSKHLDVI
jgi:hypothetical protein